MLNSRDIALLISANCKKIKVFKKPKISILATGDELIYYQMKKKDGNIYASSYIYVRKLNKIIICRMQL